MTEGVLCHEVLAQIWWYYLVLSSFRCFYSRLFYPSFLAEKLSILTSFLPQIKQLNEPIEVKITEWNTGGLLTRIEVIQSPLASMTPAPVQVYFSVLNRLNVVMQGLRAFLPKAELMNRVNSFTDLKENVSWIAFTNHNSYVSHI